MARDLDWGDLRLGVFASIAVVVSVFSIIFFARVGQLRGDKKTLYVYSDDANGVMPGTEVWLSGEKVGQVKRVLYRPITTDTLRRLAIQTEIMASMMNFIRRDARVDIRPGGNLIGAPIINITGGTSGFPALESGDTIAAISASAFKPLGVRVATLTEQMDMLADTARKLAAIINSSQGTVGALKLDGLPKMPASVESMDNLMRQATSGDGTIGLASRNDIAGRLARLTAAKDSISALLASGDGNLGRFSRDSTLTLHVASIKSQIDSLKTRFSGQSTVSRARTDSALTKEMARVSAELAALMADIKKNPGAYISF